MNYYNEIKNKLIDNEVYEKVKDYSKERHKVITYFEIGKLLNEAGGKYGERIIKEYANRLIAEFGKKYNERTLRRMRQYYRTFKDQKWSTMSTKLSWSHYTEFLSIKDENELMYYLNLCINQRIDVRSLRKKIKSKEYNRLPIETKNKLIHEGNIDIQDLVPNPIIINNTKNIEIINEKALHNLILEDIESFMKKLGTSFSFIGSEYKIKIGDRYNHIDLLLYNYEYNCFVVIELKVTELKKEHIGQIQVYMNYIDNHLKKISQDKTIGIIICKRENKFVIEYVSDDRITVRVYKLM